MDIIIPGSEIYPVTQLLPEFWIGTISDASKLSVENPLGIEEVINVCGEDYEHNPAIHYTMVNLQDGHEIPENIFWQVVNYGVECLLSGKRTIIHCHAGRSRSVGLAAAILTRISKMNFEAALGFIKRKRPIAFPHHIILLSCRKNMKLWPYSEEWTQK
jgi:protein-tyrosine phosphatase